jgi:hypothetical protein
MLNYLRHIRDILFFKFPYLNRAQANFSDPWEIFCALWQYLYLYQNKTLCKLTLPYLTKVNILGPNPAHGSLDLAHLGVTLLQPIITWCQITNLKSYQNLVQYILGPLKLTCAINRSLYLVLLRMARQKT